MLQSTFSKQFQCKSPLLAVQNVSFWYWKLGGTVKNPPCSKCNIVTMVMIMRITTALVMMMTMMMVRWWWCPVPTAPLAGKFPRSESRYPEGLPRPRFCNHRHFHRCYNCYHKPCFSPSSSFSYLSYSIFTFFLTFQFCCNILHDD